MSSEPPPLDSRLTHPDSAVAQLSCRLEAAADQNNDDSRRAALEWKMLQDLSNSMPRMVDELGAEHALAMMTGFLHQAVSLGDLDPVTRREHGDSVNRVMNAFADSLAS